MNKRLKTALTVLAVALVVGAFATRWLEQKPESGALSSGETPRDRIRSGPYQIEAAIEPGAPQVGENHLLLAVMDEQGKPVEGARLTAYAQMAAMGAMPAMRAPAEFKESSPGRYEGKFKLEMAGEWPLTVEVEKPGLGAARLSFDMATGRQGLNLASGGQVMRGGGTAQTAVSGQPAMDAEGFIRAGKFTLAVKTEPQTLQVGQNHVTIHVSDREKNTVSGARVRGLAEAQGSEPSEKLMLEFEPMEPGQYVGTLTLAHAGNWTLALDVEAAGLGHADLIFDLKTGEQGVKLATATPAGIAYYTCSMHNSVRSAGPGKCPICSMDLVPVTHEELGSGTITLDSARRQLIGLKTDKAARRALTRELRAVGRVAYDETRMSDVTLRFEARVEALQADYVGKRVLAGEPLFSVYGPELVAAQREYLEVRKRLAGHRDLVAAARKRLLRWDFTEAQITALERRGQPLNAVPIFAPRSGVIVEKRVVAGSANPAGTPLLRIADLSRVWIEADVYEADLALVRAGMSAEVSLPYLPGRVFEGRVDYVYPYLTGETRTGRVRLTLDNRGGLLKPEMYAEVKLKADLGEVLAVPEEAVLVAGNSRVVFVDLGEGRLKPQRIKTGFSADGYVEVLEGLQAGDEVVTSGNFLIAAESRLKTGIAQW